jgi:hypothetical protein
MEKCLNLTGKGRKNGSVSVSAQESVREIGIGKIDDEKEADHVPRTGAAGQCQRRLNQKSSSSTSSTSGSTSNNQQQHKQQYQQQH